MSTNVVGVVSASESYTSTTPPFCATNTRPSGWKRTTVGLFRPEKTVSSTNRGGSSCAWTYRTKPTTNATTTAAKNEAPPRRLIPNPCRHDPQPELLLYTRPRSAPERAVATRSAGRAVRLDVDRAVELASGEEGPDDVG